MSIIDVLVTTLQECFHFLLVTLNFHDSRYNVDFNITTMLIGGFAVGCLFLVIGALFSLRVHGTPDRKLDSESHKSGNNDV